ncbi:MAG: RecX family transcriptional regulator, partial [Porphyromonadaceae bacterium]|nr:RecX family transcriptional regulator [Porphyromonadaceae bacterium]
VYDRLTRFALYRGYPYEDVREAISELLSDLPDELGDD